MPRHVALSFFLSLLLSANAQEVPAPIGWPGPDIDANATVQEAPEFPGGMPALMDFLSAHVVYPKDALDQGVEGKVYIAFMVDKDGSVKDVEVARGAGLPSLGEEAVRVVGLLPPWKPGRLDGRPVKVRYTLPVNFRLTSPVKSK